MTSEYLLENTAVEAGHRFGALADIFDEVTFRHFERVGVAGGWRCWEVGAGGVSVASWLADRTCPNGHVLATDIDTSWMRHEDPTSFEVQRHDAAVDEPPGAFDLVHARLVLTHVRDRDAALHKMVASLRPGGYVVIEDFDVSVQPRAVIDTTCDDLVANRIRAGFESLLAERGVDLEFGRKLPRLLRECGLVDVAADAYMPVAMPAVAALEEANVHQVRDALVARRYATNPEIQCHLQALRQGRLDISTPPLVSAWGRKPAD